MKFHSQSAARVWLHAGVLVFGLAALLPASAQPIIVSNYPSMGASGISPTASVVFRFSAAMDTTVTTASFFDAMNPMLPIVTTEAWTAGDTVLTCTPVSPFPSPNRMIAWSVDGADTQGNPLNGESGYFTTGTGSGGSGSGTNRITTFSAAKLHGYQQFSTALPVLDTNGPFSFSAGTTLASNRTANTITLTLPGGSVSNLTQNMFAHEDYYLYYFTAVSNQFENTFPQGNYLFSVYSSQSNQQVTVTMPLSMAQPPAPHIANYSAAQAVNPTQAFVLSWDPIAGGQASDFISVSIGDWHSPDYGLPGALNGTAISYTIPAGTLQVNSNYSASISIYRLAATSNATYSTVAGRATSTEFNLQTTGGASAPAPVVLNLGWVNGKFGFDINTVQGQMLTVVSSADCTLPMAQWPVMTTTNASLSRIRVVDPNSTNNRTRFYRVRNGP